MRAFAIIPAAGRSERMGQPKLLLPWNGTTIIEHVLGVWQSSRVNAVVAVVHPLDDELAERARRAGAAVVRPDPPPPDMKASVHEGLAYVARALQPDVGDSWLSAPADMPAIDRATIDRLIDAYQSSIARGGEPRIWVPSVGGRRGHPVLFPWGLAEEVGRLGSDEGLSALAARHGVETIDPGTTGILDDLDTREDYERLRRQHGQ